MADIKRALSMIGICKKAGRLLSGVPIVVDAIRDGKVILCVYAAQAAKNSLKRVTDKANSYSVEAISLDVSPMELAHSIGKSGAVSAIGITDSGFAEAIKKIISE